MTGIYFSGTGNTKHCTEYLLRLLEEDALTYSIEDKEAVGAIQAADTVVFAYPVYYSNLPKFVYDFIVGHAAVWREKKIMIVATMGLFSGDGAGCAARLLKKYGAEILGGVHLKMPDCIGDVKILKKPLKACRKTVAKAHAKLEKAARRIKSGRYPKNGLTVSCRIVGLLGQRLYFRRKSENYFNGVKIDRAKCVACGVCVSLCPTRNMEIKDNKAVGNGNCTMCYRCFVNCPRQAITIIGKRVVRQNKMEDYLSE